jgi:hypothetical protein
MGLLKKAGGAAVLAGGAAALAKRLADRQQQKGRSQVADEPGGADGRASPVPAPAAAPVTKPAPADVSIADEIEQLVAMRDQGTLSGEEFSAAKVKLLGV